MQRCFETVAYMNNKYMGLARLLTISYLKYLNACAVDSIHFSIVFKITLYDVISGWVFVNSRGSLNTKYIYYK